MQETTDVTTHGSSLHRLVCFKGEEIAAEFSDIMFSAPALLDEVLLCFLSVE